MMADIAHGHDDHGHGHGPVNPVVEVIQHPKPSLYRLTYGILFVLLIVTVVLYYIDLSAATRWVGMNFVVAMFVAVIKAGFVVYNFMNVRGSTKLTWLWAVLGFVWLMLMAGIFVDYRSRPSQGGWESQYTERMR
jgi:caa(3)-type oxidase subunit IV